MKDSYECRKIDGLDERLEEWLEEDRESFEDGATSEYAFDDRIIYTVSIYRKYL